jgi:hypothetical protein
MKYKTPLCDKTPFAINPKPLDEYLTARGGTGLISRVFRSLRLPGTCQANLGALHRHAKGFEGWQTIETINVGVMLGAERLEDLDHLRKDEGVQKLLGYTPPSARAIRDYLEKFHDEQGYRRTKDSAHEQGALAFIPDPTEGLKGLTRVLGHSARGAASKGSAVESATIDQDATIAESRKRTATWTYEGVKGYQPMVAVWAEADVVVAAEFRDGNVPAGMSPLTCCKMAFGALPEGLKRYAYRGDSACYEWNLLNWLRDEQRPDGPAGRIEFAVSAKMSEQLHSACVALKENAWTTIGKPEVDGTVRQWAEVPYVPSEPKEKKHTQPLRYIGIRVTKAQGLLFDDGTQCRHFAVATNRQEKGEWIVNWHRQKAGTVEHVHDELKNALAAAALPSQLFGANAAWFLINCIGYNLSSVIRATAPEESLRTARLKQLRFRLLNVTARVARDRRKISVRFAAPLTWVKNMIASFNIFQLKTQPTG